MVTESQNTTQQNTVKERATLVLWGLTTWFSVDAVGLAQSPVCHRLLAESESEKAGMAGELPARCVRLSDSMPEGALQLWSLMH
jgi:hypothetical protein